MHSVSKIVLVISLFFALAVSPGLADDADPVILVLGDSLSAAYNMELDQAWPSLLQDRLTEDGYAYRVFNSSIVGDTTQSGLTRLPRLLSDYQPTVVIIELGGNDGLRGLPLGVTRSNLESMIDQSLAIGASVVLAGIHIPPNYGKTYTERFSKMYQELAVEYDVQFIPFLLEGIALDPSLMLEDGIHPTSAAQPLIVDTVLRALDPVL
ncbi:MAG TPA: arylesterase [Xanthomonadales bacterium]|nr:arylesterase [Xanthomonadales bacterium]